jgi:O-antigen/teichoic acid export membrane protein
MSLTRIAIRGAGWAVAGGYASQLLAFVMFLIVSRLVGPSAFGTVAVAIAIVELCRAIAVESVAANLTAQPVFDEQSFNAGFAWAMTSATILAIGVSLAAPLFALLFQTPGLTAVLPQIALLLLFQAASRLQEARLTQQMRFRSLAARAVASALIGGGVGIAAAQAGMGVTALVWQQWAGALASLVLLWIACPWRPRLRFSRADFDKLNRANLALAPANLITSLSLLLDGLAAASFAGPAAAGVYNLGKRIRLAMQIALSSAIDRVTLPAFARINARAEQLAPVLEKAIRFSTLVAFPIFFGLAAIAPDLIALCLGAEWVAAATPTTLLLIGGALAIAGGYCENTLLVLDQRRWILAMRALYISVLAIGLLSFGRFGPDAIAAVSLVASAAHCLGALYAAARVTGLPLRNSLAALAMPLGISLAMLTLLTAVRVFELQGLGLVERTAIQIVLGASFYVAAIWLFARPSVRAMIQAARGAL